MALVDQYNLYLSRLESYAKHPTGPKVSDVVDTNQAVLQGDIDTLQREWASAAQDPAAQANVVADAINRVRAWEGTAGLAYTVLADQATKVANAGAAEETIERSIGQLKTMSTMLAAGELTPKQKAVKAILAALAALIKSLADDYAKAREGYDSATALSNPVSADESLASLRTLAVEAVDDVQQMADLVIVTPGGTKVGIAGVPVWALLLGAWLLSGRRVF